MVGIVLFVFLLSDSLRAVISSQSNLRIQESEAVLISECVDLIDVFKRIRDVGLGLDLVLFLCHFKP